jgi:hypothetical protein
MSREVLGMLAEGFSGPLVFVAALVGVGGALLTRPAPSATTEEAPPPLVVTEVPATPSTDDAPGDEVPPTTASAAEIEALLAAGDHERAERWATASGRAPLAVRAKLLGSLAKGGPPGPVAKGPVVQVTALDGSVHLGAVRTEDDQQLVLAGRDGHEVRLQRAQVRERKALDPAAAARALDQALLADRNALGERPSGLVLHRLALQAFSCGARSVGTTLLVDALVSAEGGIIVDMFGEGDVDALHRAREALVKARAGGEAPATDTEVVAMNPDPAPRPRTERPPPRPATTRPPPRPNPSDPGPEPSTDEHVETVYVNSTDDDVVAHPTWVASDAAYRTGLELYRKGAALPIQSAAPSVRGAMRQFRLAQDLLEKLSTEVPESPDTFHFGRRVQELNSLILDCQKRLGVAQ